MRIGIYDPYLDDCGGGEKYMLSMAEYLSKDHKVDLFWDNKEDVELASRRFSLDLSNVQMQKNIFAPNFSLFSRLLTSRKYDIMVILSDGSIPILFSKKVFLHFQRPIEHVVLSQLTKLKIGRVKRVFCNSEYTKSYIDQSFHVNSIVIYPPVEFHSRQIKKENWILHVGRFRVFDKTVGVGDFKKQHAMIDFFKDLYDEGLKSLKFVIAVSVQPGDMQVFEKMKQEAKGYPIEFKINKTNDELWELYSRAKIYWHASGFGEDLKKNPELAEHFGISTVEAMSAGAVPIVIGTGGQAEIITHGENGLLWNTKEECLESTKMVAGDEKLRIGLSKHAIESSRKYSKEQFCHQISQLLQL